MQLISSFLFLEKENIPKELVEAFRGMDPGRKGVIKAQNRKKKLIFPINHNFQI